MKKIVFGIKIIAFLLSLIFLPVAGAENSSAEQKKVFEQAEKLFDNGKYGEAFPIFAKLASQKHAQAAMYAGTIKFNAGDKKTAGVYFKQASELGELNAKYYLGIMYFSGNGVEQDTTSAFRLFREVADASSDKESCFLVGKMLIDGTGTKVNLPLSSVYLKIAATPSEEGKIDFPHQKIAQLLYGVWCMEREKAQKTDYLEAYKFLELAAAQKIPEAWYKLGYLYTYGLGIPAPDRKRAELCFLAADRLKKSGINKYNIGLIRFENGDEKGARYWMKLAAAEKYKGAADFLEDLDSGKIKLPQKKKEKTSSLGSSMDSFFNSQERVLGTSARSMMEIRQISREKMIRLPYPENIKISGWDFTYEEMEKKIADDLALNRDGERLLKNGDFDKEPLESNLLALNPTIRFINKQGEIAVFQAMKNAKFRRCSKAETLDMLKKLKDASLDNKEREDALWQLRSDLYFHYNADFSGRWQLRQYTFIAIVDKKPTVITYFSEPPTKEDAIMTEGILRRDPACLNNYAVRLEEGEITRIFREDDTVKEILTVLAASGNKVACHNLGVFHLKRGEKKEADKYFDKAQKPAASVGR